MKNLRNVLYGLGIGEDNENTIKYMNNNAENYKPNVENEKRYNPNNTPVEDIVNTKIELYSDSSEFAKKCSIHQIDIKWDDAGTSPL